MRNRVRQTDFGEFETTGGGIWRIGPVAPPPIAVVSDNGPCFRGEVFKTAFAGPDPLLRHVRTRVRSPHQAIDDRAPSAAFIGGLVLENFAVRTPTPTVLAAQARKPL
ncbi:hypothetical protein ABIA39_007429 [Nocardia sp. GAS34]|uniref:hypothetical protein n=1 Tax=unclassified Nocardia TaxID=2637762 RepID=UPI003D20BC7A